MLILSSSNPWACPQKFARQTHRTERSGAEMRASKTKVFGSLVIDLRSAVILHIRRCVEYVEILIGNGLFFFPNVETHTCRKGGGSCTAGVEI